MFFDFDLHSFSGLSFATSKPTAPKPSCPRGLYVTWAPSNNGLWMCCKNSDCRGVKDCKEGQSPFPYGPRHKLVCCQCPTGQVLNKEKNGCMSTGVPSSSLTSKPTLSPIYPPTPSPTYEAIPFATYRPTPSGTPPPPTYEPTQPPTSGQTPPPTYQPTPSGTPPPPTHEPTQPPTTGQTPPPTYQPTPSGTPPPPTYEPTQPPTTGQTPPPTYQPTPSGTPPPPTSEPTHAPTEAGTSDPTKKPDCEDGYIKRKSDTPLLDRANVDSYLQTGFEMCCQDITTVNYGWVAPKVGLYYEKKDGAVSKFQLIVCYCLDDQKFYKETYNPYTRAFCK